jgi:hypothetical protein
MHALFAVHGFAIPSSSREPTASQYGFQGRYSHSTGTPGAGVPALAGEGTQSEEKESA